MERILGQPAGWKRTDWGEGTDSTGSELGDVTGGTQAQFFGSQVRDAGGEAIGSGGAAKDEGGELVRCRRKGGEHRAHSLAKTPLRAAQAPLAMASEIQRAPAMARGGGGEGEGDGPEGRPWGPTEAGEDDWEVL